MNVVIRLPEGRRSKDECIKILDEYFGALAEFSEQLFGTLYHRGNTLEEALQNKVQKIEEIMWEVADQFCFGAWNGLENDLGIGITGTIGADSPYVTNQIVLSVSTKVGQQEIIEFLKDNDLWIEPKQRN